MTTSGGIHRSLPADITISIYRSLPADNRFISLALYTHSLILYWIWTHNMTILSRTPSQLLNQVTCYG